MCTYNTNNYTSQSKNLFGRGRCWWRVDATTLAVTGRLCPCPPSPVLPLFAIEGFLAAESSWVFIIGGSTCTLILGSIKRLCSCRWCLKGSVDSFTGRRRSKFNSITLASSRTASGCLSIRKGLLSKPKLGIFVSDWWLCSSRIFLVFGASAPWIGMP